MKKLIIWTMLFAIVIVGGGSIRGDVNYDGRVNVLDMTMISRYLQGRLLFTSYQRRMADYNCDGLVNTNDLTAIADYIMGR